MEIFKGAGSGIDKEMPAMCDCRCYIRCKGTTYPYGTAFQDWEQHLSNL